jgi:hypothetical protein
MMLRLRVNSPMVTSPTTTTVIRVSWNRTISNGRSTVAGRRIHSWAIEL